MKWLKSNCVRHFCVQYCILKFDSSPLFVLISIIFGWICGHKTQNYMYLVERTSYVQFHFIPFSSVFLCYVLYAETHSLLFQITFTILCFYHLHPPTYLLLCVWIHHQLLYIFTWHRYFFCSPSLCICFLLTWYIITIILSN